MRTAGKSERGEKPENGVHSAAGQSTGDGAQVVVFAVKSGSPFETVRYPGGQETPISISSVSKQEGSKVHDRSVTDEQSQVALYLERLGKVFDYAIKGSMLAAVTLSAGFLGGVVPTLVHLAVAPSQHGLKMNLLAELVQISNHWYDSLLFLADPSRVRSVASPAINVSEIAANTASAVSVVTREQLISGLSKGDLPPYFIPAALFVGFFAGMVTLGYMTKAKGQ